MISNLEVWLTVGAWAAIVITASYGLARWAAIKPRLRACLLLTGFACSFIPLFMHSSIPISEPTVQREPVQGITQMEIPAHAGPVQTFEPEPLVDQQPQLDKAQLPIWDILVMVWIFGSSIGVVWLLNDIRKMNRLVRTKAVQSPIVAGFPRAVVLLPKDWPNQLSEDEAKAALEHEHAHVKGFHIAGRVVTELARCLFWWLPTAHLSARLYEQCLEEIADAEALKTNTPRSLANALLKVAERGAVSRLCAGATSQGEQLEMRIKKIMNRQSPGRWSVSALIVVVGFSGAVAFAPKLPVSQEFGKVMPIFGMAKGSSWTYQVERSQSKYKTTKDVKDGKVVGVAVTDDGIDSSKPVSKGTLEYAVSKVIPSKPMTVYRLNIGETVYEYRGVAEDGLYEVGRGTMDGSQFDPKNPNPLIKKPYRKGTEWSWRRVFRGQYVSDLHEKIQPGDLDSDCTAKIEAEEDVKVPAGTFGCLRVRTKYVSKRFGKFESVDWISLAHGLIKRQVFNHKNEVRETYQLSKYVLGESSPGINAP